MGAYHINDKAKDKTQFARSGDPGQRTRGRPGLGARPAGSQAVCVAWSESRQSGLVSSRKSTGIVPNPAHATRYFEGRHSTRAEHPPLRSLSGRGQ